MKTKFTPSKPHSILINNQYNIGTLINYPFCFPLILRQWSSWGL